MFLYIVVKKKEMNGIKEYVCRKTAKTSNEDVKEGTASIELVRKERHRCLLFNQIQEKRSKSEQKYETSQIENNQ